MTMQTVPQSLANLKMSQRLGGTPAPGPPSAQRGPATQISSYITSTNSLYPVGGGCLVVTFNHYFSNSILAQTVLGKN